MAALALIRAGEALDCLPSRSRTALMRTLGLTGTEIDAWKRIARRMRVCFIGDGIISQFEGFDRLKPFDGRAYAEQHPNGRVDWQLAATGDSADAYQVSKQPDVLMLLYLLLPTELIKLLDLMGYQVDMEAMRRTARYYLDRMAHESSLSRAVCAGALAALDPAASWSFFKRTLRIDFDPQNSASSEEGLHLGAMAATLDVLQRHYLGLTPARRCVAIVPAPPPALPPVRMRLWFRDLLFWLEWDGAGLCVRADGSNQGALPLSYAGRAHRLAAGEELRLN